MMEHNFAGYQRSGPEYKVKLVVTYAVLIGGAVLMAAPVWWAVTTALSTNPTSTNVIFSPHKITLSNFKYVFNNINIGRWFVNSLIVAFAVTIFNLVFDSLAGYALAQIDFWGRDKLFLIFVSTMMVPGMVTIIPLYLILSDLGWTNTYYGLVIVFAANPLGIFLLRQFFLGVPNSLGEAAKLDGLNELQIFYKIYLPLAKPALATLGIFIFMMAWNNFEWPLIIMQDQSMYTLTVGLYAVRGEFFTDWGLVMAVAVVLVTPTILVFLSAQKYFINGMTLSGLKG